MKITLYGIYNEEGKLDAVKETEWDAKSYIFDCQSDEFRYKYWHKAALSYRAAKKLGWKIEIGEYKSSKKFLK